MTNDASVAAKDVLGWIEAHDAAWRANDVAAIGGLFSEDGVYHLGPWEGPWRGMDGPFRGRDAIIAGWLAGADTSERFAATTEILAIVDRRAIVERRITYLSPDDEPVERYGCIWLLDFDHEGRCREYQEWFVPDERLHAGLAEAPRAARCDTPLHERRGLQPPAALQPGVDLLRVRAGKRAGAADREPPG